MGNRSRRPPGEGHQRPLPPPGMPGPDLGVPVHSPYTVEGRIEQVGAMAHGIKRLSGGKRVAALTVFFVVFVGPLLIMLASMLWFTD